jgi:hypothetical protein
MVQHGLICLNMGLKWGKIRNRLEVWFAGKVMELLVDSPVSHPRIEQMSVYCPTLW